MGKQVLLRLYLCVLFVIFVILFGLYAAERHKYDARIIETATTLFQISKNAIPGVFLGLMFAIFWVVPLLYYIHERTANKHLVHHYSHIPLYATQQ